VSAGPSIFIRPIVFASFFSGSALAAAAAFFETFSALIAAFLSFSALSEKKYLLHIQLKTLVQVTIYGMALLYI